MDMSARVLDWPYSTFHRMVRAGVCIRRIGLAIVEMTKEISAKGDGIRSAAARRVG